MVQSSPASKSRRSGTRRSERPIKLDRIGTPKHHFLCSIGRFHYLKDKQLARLHYKLSSLSMVREELAELYHAHYLDKAFLPIVYGLGRSPGFYCLDNLGYRYLKERDLEPQGRFRASEEKKRAHLFLQHTEASNDLMITALLLPTADPRIKVRQYRTERELKHTPIRITYKGERIGLVPDGWLQFEATRKAAIAFELDRNTIRREDWNKKIIAYTQALHGPYEETFGVRSLTLAIVALEVRRAQELIIWTEDCLRELGDTSLAHSMFFTYFDPATADPIRTFLEPIWLSPISRKRQSLLPNELFA